MALFDIEIKHSTGKHHRLSDYLGRNPIGNPVSTGNYVVEYVSSYVLPLLEYIINYGSIDDDKVNSTNGSNNRFSPN